MRTHSSRKISGLSFTLVELLVVIAVIAVLSGLLLPALNKARDRAKTINCMGNMRQFMLNVGEYMNDFGCYYPLISYADAYLYFGQVLYINGYVSGNGRQMRCEALKPWSSWSDLYKMQTYGLLPASVYQKLYLNTAETGNASQFTFIKDVKSPSNTIMMQDSVGSGATWTPGSSSPGGYQCTATSTGNSGIHLRHNGLSAANAGFVDSHVETVNRFTYVDALRREYAQTKPSSTLEVWVRVSPDTATDWTNSSPDFIRVYMANP